jgi:hypothetical protein
LGLMDRVKAQVDSLAQQANAGMAKLDNLPVQRKSDGLLRSLGVAVLADRTGRGNPGSSAEIDRLITEITQHESQNNIDIVQQAAQAAAQAAQFRSQMGPMGQGQVGQGGMGPMGQGQGQMGPGSYMPSSPPAANQNVAGTMPGAGAGYGGYGAPTGPGPGGPGGPTGSSAAPGGYPGAQGGLADAPGGFPAGQGGFPKPEPQQDQPEYPA